MKKIVFTLMTLTLTTLPTMAQYYPDGRPIPPRHRAEYYSGRANWLPAQRTYYGFRVGLSLGTVRSDSPYLDANDAKAGLNVGFALGTRLADSAPLYFETGLYYTEKGGKSTYGGSKFTYGLDYLELPLLLKYKYQASRDVSIEPFLGGYVGVGVAGKIKDFGTRQAYNSFGDDYAENFSRFDGGLRLGCGLSFQMLYIEASYDLGLANVGNDEFDDTRTGAFMLTAGVNF